ncbi:MAG TPA: hypothetical protein VK171_04555 [Fimbriimonas sp.]|nr:hypothetical protein [Fimbriimonas sp.]
MDAVEVAAVTVEDRIPHRNHPPILRVLPLNEVLLPHRAKILRDLTLLRHLGKTHHGLTRLRRLGKTHHGLTRLRLLGKIHPDRILRQTHGRIHHVPTLLSRMAV